MVPTFASSLLLRVPRPFWLLSPPASPTTTQQPSQSAPWISLPPPRSLSLSRPPPQHPPARRRTPNHRFTPAALRLLRALLAAAPQLPPRPAPPPNRHRRRCCWSSIITRLLQPTLQRSRQSTRVHPMLRETAPSTPMPHLQQSTCHSHPPATSPRALEP